MKTAPALPPVAAAACDQEWIELRREIILREGRAVRAGEGCSIEIKSLTPRDQLAEHDPLRTNQWQRMTLPDRATQFTTEADRDAVLAQLTSATTTL